MTIYAANVVAPMFTSTEVVMFLLACMASETCFRRFFCRLILEGDDLGWIAFSDVILAWSVTGFTSSHLFFPTSDISELCV
jgi:hydrogenase maturation factor